MTRFYILVLLLSWPSAANELLIKPRLCIEHAGKPCVLQLTASWQQAEEVCLYQQQQPDTPLLCQQQAQSVSLSLPIAEDTHLLLKNPRSGEVLAKRQIRLLRVDLESGEQLLNKSRNGWWLLQ